MAPHVSRIVQELQAAKKNAFLTKLSGWLCVPFCCIGCACLLVAEIPAKFVEQCNALIDFYDGEKRLGVLAVKIKKEQSLFREAVTQANSVISPELIDPNITLFDVIRDMNPRINSLCMKDIYFGISKIKNLTYSQEIWRTYQQNGGNYHVVMYGIIEYMFMVYHVDSNKVADYITKVLSDTSFRVEVLSHKTSAYL